MKNRKPFENYSPNSLLAEAGGGLSSLDSYLDTTHFILEDIGRKATGKEVQELSRIQKEDLVLVEEPR